MSLILDALNRSRDDANPVPGLATHHSVESVSAERRQYLLWVALAIAVVLIAWLMLEKFGPSPSPLAEIAGQDAQPAAVADAAGDVMTTQSGPDLSHEQPVIVPTVLGQESSAQTPTPEPITPLQGASESAKVTPMYEETEPVLSDASSLDEFFVDGAQDLPAQQDTVVPTPTSSPINNDTVAQLYQNPELLDEPVRAKPAGQRSAPGSSERVSPETSGAQAAGDNIDIDKILRMAREESENAGLRDHPVPFLIDLSQQIKDSIPTVYYLRHDYSSDTARSSVVLNSKTLNVGGIPASGMKIEEILPDSVVLNYQGTQFRLRALNSWVNL